jgi:hypothetical protein
MYIMHPVMLTDKDATKNSTAMSNVDPFSKAFPCILSVQRDASNPQTKWHDAKRRCVNSSSKFAVMAD